jgi:uncharacterized protein
LKLKILDNSFEFTPKKVIYWIENQCLILTDTHFGKTEHFRRNGIAIPSEPLEKDLQILQLLIEQYQPKNIIITGDFFHSVYNDEFDKFTQLWKGFSDLKWIITKGNHDIIDISNFSNLHIEIVEKLEIGNFVFAHEHLSIDGKYCFSGHVHPGVVLSNDKGKQSIRLACFYMKVDGCILPAFASFSGYGIVKPKKNERIIAIVEDKLIEI